MKYSKLAILNCMQNSFAYTASYSSHVHVSYSDACNTLRQILCIFVPN